MNHVLEGNPPAKNSGKELSIHSNSSFLGKGRAENGIPIIATAESADYGKASTMALSRTALCLGVGTREGPAQRALYGCTLASQETTIVAQAIARRSPFKCLLGKFG